MSWQGLHNNQVEFALNRGGRVLLGDEMGLGKTAQARLRGRCGCKIFPQEGQHGASSKNPRGFPLPFILVMTRKWRPETHSRHSLWQHSSPRTSLYWWCLGWMVNRMAIGCNKQVYNENLFGALKLFYLNPFRMMYGVAKLTQKSCKRFTPTTRHWGVPFFLTGQLAGRGFSLVARVCAPESGQGREVNDQIGTAHIWLQNLRLSLAFDVKKTLFYSLYTLVDTCSAWDSERFWYLQYRSEKAQFFRTCLSQKGRHLFQERHVQIVRKGSETLRKAARVVVVSYDLIAQNDCCGFWG